MTHQGMRSAAPAAAPVCRAAGSPGFLTVPASWHQPQPGAPAGISPWPACPRPVRRPGPVMNRAGGRNALMRAIWG